VTHEQAIAFARLAAREFIIGDSERVQFDPELAKKDITGQSDVKPTRKKTAKSTATAADMASKDEQ
jgi:hypothetical protein